MITDHFSVLTLSNHNLTLQSYTLKKWDTQKIKTMQKATSRIIGWLPKFATGLHVIIGCSSKSIWEIKMSFCQNDPLMRESFWQNNSPVTYILFELQPIIIFSPVTVSMYFASIAPLTYVMITSQYFWTKFSIIGHGAPLQSYSSSLSLCVTPELQS